MSPRVPLAVLALAAGIAFTAAPARAQFFHSVFSRNGIDVLAVGDSGAIYRSFNGGVNWSNATLGSRPLRGVVARGWTIVVVGDSGKVWRSTDNGGGWALAVMPGTPNLRAVRAIGGDSLVAVGSGGTVLLSTDGGASWSSQNGQTANQLNGVWFLDARNGWIAGAGGFLAATTDGGANWNPVTLGTANDLNAVGAHGAAVWVAGDNATLFRSTDGGSGWTQLDLNADARPDVKAVWVQSADSVYITGGGGFIRRSYDGGNTWTFLQHTLQGQISALHFLGASGWASSSRVRTVLRTTDRGATWSVPAGAVTSRSWVPKLLVGTTVRGATLSINPIHKSTFYVALGNSIYRSRNDGETWSPVTSIPGLTTVKTNSFVVSAKDSNYWIAAVGLPDRIVYTEDGGTNWIDAFPRDFGEYGIPLEVDPDRPDTLYFGVDSGVLYWSTDRGKTWGPYSTTVFRSPCDIVAVPGSDSAVILVGDGITGSGQGKYYRATAGSTTFTEQATVVGSEIPGMAASRLRPANTFGTNWSSGGVQRTTNFGLSWPGVHTVGQAWGVDIARDDPDCVVFGVYSGSTGYISLTGGASGSFTGIGGLTGSNYSFFVRDRATILAEQSGGVYKLNVTQTMPTSNLQSVALMVPNGGEVWDAGSVRNITWNAANVALARIEYRRTASDPWQLVAQTEGYAGTYAWTVPFEATADAWIRVSDASDLAPADESNGSFTIALPLIAGTPASFDFDSLAIGSARLDTVRITNTGTATLNVSSISVAGSGFSPGRTALALAPGASDTVGVTFHPSQTVSYLDTLVIVSDGYNQTTIRVPLVGVGLDTLYLRLAAPDGGEQWQYGTNQKIAWQSALVAAVDIHYRTSPAGAWIQIADSVAAAPGTYVWTVPDAPSAECRLRVREHGAAAVDVSQSDFSIVVPYFQAGPVPLNVGTTSVGQIRSDTLHIGNPGTAPLSISSVTSSDGRFWPGRTSLVIPAGGSDSLGVFYLPTAVGCDSAIFTLLADDPAATHTVRVKGNAVPNVAVPADPRAPIFALLQNQPNPFTGRTQIHYSLARSSPVSLEVFSLQGQLVATLVRGVQGPGAHCVDFGPGAPTHSGSRLGTLHSGVYFYRLRTREFSATRKMILMR